MLISKFHPHSAIYWTLLNFLCYHLWTINGPKLTTSLCRTVSVYYEYVTVIHSSLYFLLCLCNCLSVCVYIPAVAWSNVNFIVNRNWVLVENVLRVISWKVFHQSIQLSPSKRVHSCCRFLPVNSLVSIKRHHALWLVGWCWSGCDTDRYKQLAYKIVLKMSTLWQTVCSVHCSHYRTFIYTDRPMTCVCFCLIADIY